MSDSTIATAGTGYTGLPILPHRRHSVMRFLSCIVPRKVEPINNRKSPIQEEYTEKYPAKKDLNLPATPDAKLADNNADVVVIAASSNVYPKFSVDFSWAMMTDKIIRYCRKMRLSGTGLGIVISTFSNEMERAFLRAMGWIRAY